MAHQYMKNGMSGRKRVEIGGGLNGYSEWG
jgi:hypothetical protein